MTQKEKTALCNGYNALTSCRNYFIEHANYSLYQEPPDIIAVKDCIKYTEMCIDTMSIMQNVLEEEKKGA